MAKKKQYTFADEAKALQKRFPRRETDPIEKRDYQESMMRLMQEQELARQEMGLDQPQEEFKGGGKMKYQDGGYHSKLPTDFAIQSAIALGPALRNQNPQIPFNKPANTPDLNTLPWSHGETGQSQYLTPQQLATMGEPWERPTTSAIPASTPNTGGTTRNTRAAAPATRDPLITNTDRIQSIGTPQIGTRVPNQTNLTVEDPGRGTFAPQEGSMDKYGEYMPYAASGLANIASNLLLARQASRNVPQVAPTVGTPERINLEPQAEALRRQATTARNTAITNARNLGVNPMGALAGIGAASAGIDRGLGENLTNLYVGQERANVGAANQFALANMQARDRANMFNEQARGQAKQDQLGYLGAAMGTIPGVMKDIRMDRADQAMRDVMQSYYNSMGRNYMVEGDIFDNPQDGFRYKVRNNELVRVGKNQ